MQWMDWLKIIIKKNYFKPNVVPILKCTQGFGKYIFTCVATFTLNRYTCLFIIFQENKGYYELITNLLYFTTKGFGPKINITHTYVLVVITSTTHDVLQLCVSHGSGLLSREDPYLVANAV